MKKNIRNIQIEFVFTSYKKLLLYQTVSIKKASIILFQKIVDKIRNNLSLFKTSFVYLY